MRLVSLELAGFRGFGRSQVFDLDAEAVLVIGANGHGKTSLFDGILWALCGRIPRLGAATDVVLSKFSESGEAHAKITVRLPDGSSCSISRLFDGENTRVSVAIGGAVFEGPSAEGKLIDLLWKEAAAASDSQGALASVITRSVYLQQDLVRDFVEAVSVEDRFTVVSELIGAGRVADIQQQLERAKAAWSKFTNSQDEDLIPLKVQLATMEASLAEIVARRSEGGHAQLESKWDSWWRGLERQAIDTRSQPLTSREASVAIDAGIRLIEAERHAAERRLQAVVALQSDIHKLSEVSSVDVAALRKRVESTKSELEQISRLVQTEQERAAERRRVQAALQEQSEQLRALASLALKHLGPRCPVCDQDYDPDATRSRLETLVAQQPLAIPPTEVADTLPVLLVHMASKETELAAAQLAVRSGEQADQERSALEEAITSRLSELAIEVQADQDRMAVVAQERQKANERISALGKLAKEGEALALVLTKAADEARSAELQREVDTLKANVSERDGMIRERRATGELGQQIIEALRKATSDIVTRRLRDIAPVLQVLYSRIDPHPAFRVVNFLTEVVRGKGQLYTVVQDPELDIRSNAPQNVLSSSQLNALAVSVFLSLNLSVGQPPISAMILDDPLQSLDDINLLALVDLLRRTKENRQLLVSTHNVRLGKLLARKLRPVKPNQRTITVELDGWTRQGPTVETRDVRRDPAELRLASG